MINFEEELKNYIKEFMIEALHEECDDEKNKKQLILVICAIQ